MAADFSPENLATLNNGRERVHRQLVSLREAYFLRKYRSDRAREYATHGFCRRLGILVRAIDLVFEGLPPEREDIPDRNDVVDATIAIQSFVSDTFVCLDNPAWIWVYEKGVRSEDGQNLTLDRSDLVRPASRFVACSRMSSALTWTPVRSGSTILKTFENSLTHRIPLYIPPYVILSQEAMDEYNKLEQASDEALKQRDLEGIDRLQPKQQEFSLFHPRMTHSLHERAPTVIFHPQLLQHYATIDEFGQKMLEELDLLTL